MRLIGRTFLATAMGLTLLAAGEAPDFNDLDFPADPGPVVAPVETIAIIEEIPTTPEPELGPVLPEADNLAQMVRQLKAELRIALDEELNCLAVAVYFESKGEPLDGQLAVAQVILNRVEQGRFGRDICAVVKAPRQFSFVRGGRMPAPVNREQWKTAQAIAVIAAAEGWHAIVGEATHFHATRVKPGWRMQRVAQVGNHIFYR